MKVQITNGMFMAIIINVVYSKSIGFTQGSMAREVGNDIWISTLFASILAAVIMAVTVNVMKRFPNDSLSQQGSKLLGKWFGKGVSVMIFSFFLLAFVGIMATFTYHLKDYFLPEAPTWIFFFIALLAGSYGIYFGIEIVGRMALIGLFSILTLNILLLLGSFQHFDINELLPLTQSGLLSDLIASRHHLADWAVPIMMSLVVLPMVKNKQKWTRTSLVSILFGTFFIILWPVLETGVLSAEVTGQYIISCMQMARSAQIGLYIHRYEMIMIALFAVSLLTQVMISLFCAADSLRNILNFKDYRPLIIPVSLVYGGFSYWIVEDHHRALNFIEHTWVIYGLGITIGTVFIVWVVGLFFKKKWTDGTESETQ